MANRVLEEVWAGAPGCKFQQLHTASEHTTGTPQACCCRLQGCCTQAAQPLDANKARLLLDHP
jgi:hypothetical protein